MATRLSTKSWVGVRIIIRLLLNSLYYKSYGQTTVRGSSLSKRSAGQKFLDHFAQIWMADLFKLIPHTATRGRKRNQVTQINRSRDHNRVASNCGDGCGQVLKLSGRVSHRWQCVGDPGITAKDFGQTTLSTRAWIDDLCHSVALG